MRRLIDDAFQNLEPKPQVIAEVESASTLATAVAEVRLYGITRVDGRPYSGAHRAI
jgi:hypothetical protein